MRKKVQYPSGSRYRWLLVPLLVLGVIGSAWASRISVAVFPLQSEGNDSLHSWVGFGLAESMARTLQQADSVQVWDPIFLFQADSSGWQMKSDSLARLHHMRWQWDVEVGGSYAVSGDELKADLRLYWVTSGETPLTVNLKISGPLSDFDATGENAVRKILQVTHFRLPSSEVSATGNKLSPAYRTYAAGYGFEMLGNPNAAITAYARAEEIDPSFARSACRQGVLFRKGGDFDRARAAFVRAVMHAPADPFVVAEYADFLAVADPPAKALEFVNIHRTTLGSTTTGMKAMGLISYAAGEHDRGLALLSKAAVSGATDLEPAFALATTCLKSGDYQQAIEIYNNLVRFRPECARYYAALGDAYRQAGRYMQSVSILESARNFAPDDIDILVNLAHAYVMTGLYPEAEQLLDRARQVSPSSADIDVYLGVTCWYEGRVREAQRCFEEASRTPSARQAAFNNLGGTLFYGGTVGRAIDAYEKALKCGARNETVLYNLAMASLADHRRAKAAKYFDRLLEKAPDRIDVLERQAALKDSLGEYRGAEICYRRLIDRQPGNRAAVVGLSTILVKKGKYRDALQPVEERLQQQPLDRGLMSLRALILMKMGSYEESLRGYLALQRAYPEDPEGYLGAGEAMYRLITEKKWQDCDNAILALKQAREHAPQDPAPDLYLGDLYADYKGYRELALDSWKSALAKTPDPAVRRSIKRKIAELQ